MLCCLEKSAHSYRSNCVSHMWHWYDLLPKDGSTHINVIAVVGFVSIKATNVGDRLLAASFITSAAANLSVTLFIGKIYFLDDLSFSSLQILLFSNSNVVVFAKSSIAQENGSVRHNQLCHILDVCWVTFWYSKRFLSAFICKSWFRRNIQPINFLLLATPYSQWLNTLVYTESLMVRFKLILDACLTQVAVSKVVSYFLLHLTTGQSGPYSHYYHFTKLSQWSTWWYHDSNHTIEVWFYRLVIRREWHLKDWL